MNEEYARQLKAWSFEPGVCSHIKECEIYKSNTMSKNFKKMFCETSRGKLAIGPTETLQPDCTLHELVKGEKHFEERRG